MQSIGSSFCFSENIEIKNSTINTTTIDSPLKRVSISLNNNEDQKLFNSKKRIYFFEKSEETTSLKGKKIKIVDAIFSKTTNQLEEQEAIVGLKEYYILKDRFLPQNCLENRRLEMSSQILELQEKHKEFRLLDQLFIPGYKKRISKFSWFATAKLRYAAYVISCNQTVFHGYKDRFQLHI